MKKYFIFLAAAAFMFSACNEDPVATDYPEPEAGAKYLLEGTVGAAGFTWTSQSIVGLYSATEGVKATNLECKVVGWEAPVVEGEEETTPAPQSTMTKASEYEGQAIARFDTPAMDLVKGENEFFVYTPYNAELVYVRGLIYGLDISDTQIQPAPNVAGACFACGTAKGIPGVDEAFKFTLTPVTAMAKVSVTTSEFAGYSVKKITVMDEAKTAQLGGGFNVNVSDMSFQVAESFSKVSVKVANPVALEAGKTQDFYIQLLPGVFTAVIIVEMEKDGSTVTLPIRKEGLKFEGGKTTEVAFANLSSEDNMAKGWYVPVENRKLSGSGYAYGEANTYFIQCKSGSTYTGATYTPNAEIPEEVTIDIRPRGDFFSVVDPKGATFEWAMNGNSVYAIRTAGYEASKVDPTKFEFSYDGNYTVKVKNTGAFAGAPILLMKKDNKVLWAWTFWNIAADGTKVEAIAVGDDYIANMDLGQSTTQYAVWAANKNGSNPDVVYRTTYMYQYGRPIPTFWNNFWTLAWKGAAGNVPALEGPMAMADAIANPVGLILNPANEGTLGSWSNESYQDLWGGKRDKDNNYTKGTKSIYDPCPKGWRVAWPGIYETLVASNKTYEDGVGYPGAYYSAAPDALFMAAGYGNGKTAANGRLATMGGNINGTAAGSKYGLIWTNLCGASQGSAILFHSSGASGNKDRVGTFNKTISAPVRCMKDTENR